MLSIPPATIMFLSPAIIAYAAIVTAFIPLAQTLLIVVAGMSSLISAPRAT